jgi:hypothetical protein
MRTEEEIRAHLQELSEERKRIPLWRLLDLALNAGRIINTKWVLNDKEG